MTRSRPLRTRPQPDVHNNPVTAFALPATSHRRVWDNQQTPQRQPDNAGEKFAEVRRKAATRLFSENIRSIAHSYS